MPVTPRELVPATMPLFDVLKRLIGRPWLCIFDDTGISGIVYRGSFDTLPFRLSALALLMELEHYVTAYLMRNAEDAVLKLSANRKEKAATQAADHHENVCKREGVLNPDQLKATSIVASSMFADKMHMFLGLDGHAALGFTSKSLARKAFKFFEQIRNQLAHDRSLLEFLGGSLELLATSIDLLKAITRHVRRMNQADFILNEEATGPVQPDLPVLSAPTEALPGFSPEDWAKLVDSLHPRPSQD